METQNNKTLDAVLLIRNRSKKGQLTQVQDLCEALEIETEELAPILAELSEENHLIELEQLLDKEGRTWYYSRSEMIPSYAATLLRTQEEDIVSVIAEAVRNESRIYPRATQINVFLDQPYRFSQEELDLAIARILEDESTQDIQRTASSNGVEFLFSTIHLTPFYAQRLAEWEEVGSKENP